MFYQALLGVAIASVEIRRPATGYKILAKQIKSTMQKPYDLVVAESIHHSPLLAYLDHEAFDLNCLCMTRYTQWERQNKHERFVSMKSNWCALEQNAQDDTHDARPLLAVLKDGYPYDLTGMTRLSGVPRGFAYPREPTYNLWLWSEPDCSLDWDANRLLE